MLQLAEKQKKEIRQNFSQSNNPVSQTRFEPLKKIKTKGRNSDLKSAVNAFNKLVDSNPTKEFVEYFKEENKQSSEHEKVLMQM